VDFILNGISSGIFAKGEYLPAIPRLSRMAGVSPVTMCKAQAILKKRMILSGYRGQATRVGGRPADHPPETHAAPRAGRAGPADDRPAPLTREDAYRKIFCRMRKEILDGVYEPDSTLPLVKQLKSRYRAAAITIRKAIALLCEEELVVPRRRRYAVAQLFAADAGLRIGVLINQTSLDSYDLQTGEGHNHLREIELQAAKIPLALTVTGFEWRTDQFAVKDPCAILPPADCSRIAGYVLVTNTPAQDYRDLCARLALSRKPVSVLDLDGAWLPPAPGNQPYAVFPIGVSAAPGKKVAAYLLALDHRHIAFFSMFHKSRWSQSRYQGLHDTCAEAGYPDCLRLFSMSPDDWLAGNEASDAEASSVHDMVGMRTRMGSHLEPLFEQAIAVPSITAWVAANDYIAVCAKEFLHARGVAVPGRISLVSFDDSVSAMTHRITSYNFNLAGIVGAAFRHILQSKPHSLAPQPRTVEIPGTIVGRETTARARA
jgi:DNA-binding LacI/PurR family transcriptional regulator/DNA-binding transcriptional regulator YhcF (GntR family)